MLSNKKCYDTSAKQDGTIINIRKTEFYLVKTIFTLEREGAFI